MIALSVAKLKMYSLNKAKKEKKTFFVESLSEKARNVFVMSLRLYDNKVLHNIASVLIKFFSIWFGFARFFRSYFVLPNFWS